MNQQYSQITQQLTSLLNSQQNFITLVHQQIYHSTSPFQEAILKFQITHISDMNSEFNQMIVALAKELIQKKIPYDLQLKDKFQKLLQADYLPLMRINRFQITKVSLFGFDIYVQPLQAFLNIISRIDNLRQKIQQSSIQLKEKENAELALEQGWDYYIAYSLHWKLSFNLYMLKQYLTVGSQSFLRKDREILFTGISQLYNGLVPLLKERKCMKLLNEFAQLNNALYYFHPSFNYFHFYSLLLPLASQLQPIFSSIKQIAQKCIRTNILTPFLFGILRNRKDFLTFIHQADSPIWLPYLNAIISGIAINLKFRILQYEQILQIFEQSALKAGLLGTIRTQYVLGTLEQGWKEAKDFFISACKIGFRSGDVQSWKTIPFQSIGQRIIGSLLDGMILGMKQNEQSIKVYLQNSEDRLGVAIKQISKDKIDLYFMKNTIYQLQNNLTSQKQVFALIRIVNLIKINSLVNQYSVNFVLSCFNKIAFQPTQISKQRLAQSSDKLNQMIFSLGNANFTFLKDKIVEFHRLNPPSSNYSSLINLYSSCFEPKKCLTSLLALPIDQTKYEQFILIILSKYVPKPSNKQIVIKTFDQQFITKSSYVNLSYQTHCLINLLTQQITKGSKSAQIAIHILVKVCPWISFALLNFPISIENQLSSFSTWLIQNEKYHKLLKDMIEQSNGKILSQKGEDLIKKLLYASILDHLSKRINEASEVQSIQSLCNLTFNIAIKIKDNRALLINLIALYLYLLSHAQSSQTILQLVNTIAILSEAVFKDKLHVWMMCLLFRRIESKSHLSTNYRKRTLKTNNANVYFLGQTLPAKEQPLIYQELQQLKDRLAKPAPILQVKSTALFESILKALPLTNYQQFEVVNKKQNIQFLQQINLFDIPTLPINVLNALLERKESSAIQLLSLNLQNYTRLVEKAIETGNVGYLVRQRFDKNIIKYIPFLFELESKTNQQLIATMSNHLSLHQKVVIAQNFFIEPSTLQCFCQHSSNIEYLCVLNNNNWRIVTEHYIKMFSQSQLTSVISQYHQFIKITGKQNDEYQTTIKQYGSHFSHFASLICFKIDSVFSLSTSKEQLALRAANQLSSLNIILSSIHLKEILVKLSFTNRTLIDKKISPLQEWVEIALRLNSTINNKYKGNILLCNFINNFYFTNQTVYQIHKIQLGLFLQQYYQNLQTTTPKHYVPQIKQLTLDEFNKYSCEQHVVISKVGLKEELINKKYVELVKELQGCNIVKLTAKKISLNSIVNPTKAYLKQMYVLGCYHVLAPKQIKFQLVGLLQFALQRKALNWEILKEVNSQGYLHIQNVISDPQIAKKNFTYIYKGKPLIANGEGVKVNEYNKLDYCNRVGVKLIGEHALTHLKYFMRGLYYQAKV